MRLLETLSSAKASENEFNEGAAASAVSASEASAVPISMKGRRRP